MLRYYSYYNVGGYKDMFLGDSTMSDPETYYLPMLSIWKKKGAAGDADAAAKIKSFGDLPKIQLLSSKDSLGLPREAEPMFSHGGYKVINAVNLNGESIFAIRDIESSSKDETGRKIPFLLVIVGTDAADAEVLEKVTAYACSHLESFSRELAELFYYDPDKNGVVFKLSSMNSLVSRIADEESNSLLTLEGIKEVNSKPGTVSLLVLPEGISKEVAINEQGLKKIQVQVVSIDQIVPIDNKQELIKTLKHLKNVRESVMTDRRVLYIIGGAVILGLIAGYLIGKS